MITRQLLELKNDRFENLLKNLRLKRDAMWSWNIGYIFTSDTVLFEKKTEIYSSLFQIKSLRAC